MTFPPRTYIEEAMLNAWPAVHDTRCDAWRLRTSEGFTDRANSATFMGPGRQALPLPDSIKACESQFFDRELPPVFRLPSFCTPPPVKQALLQRGYQAAKQTHVMQRRVADGSATTPSPEQGRLRSLDSVDSWLEHYERFGGQSGVSAQTGAAHARILQAIASPRLLASWEVANEIVACGLAVHDGPLCGIFDVVVAKQQRRQGYGRLLVEAMVQWGRTCDAKVAYLQVEASNTAASSLYRRLEFTERYNYRYWRRE